MSWQHTPQVPRELNSKSEVLEKRSCAELIPSATEPSTRNDKCWDTFSEDTGHRCLAEGSQRWSWWCWGSPGTGDHSATSPRGPQERIWWTRAGTPHAMCELQELHRTFTAGSHSQPRIPQDPCALKASRIRNLSVANFSPLKSFPSETREGKTAEFCHFPTQTLSHGCKAHGCVGQPRDLGDSSPRPQPRGAVPEVSLAVAVDLFSAVRVTWLWALCWRSCWMSFRDSERPVPS